jgi:hypothetical protein
VIFALPGPPFFPHRASPLAATTARSDTGQSLLQNGAYRTEFWRESAEVALHRPLVGSGYHALATASALYTPSGWARSPLAHDGYLQAFSDGGLLLGVPFLASVVIVALWALRRFWVMVSRREGRLIDVTQLSVVLALLGGLAHSAVDFDWSHPSILVEAALLAACVAPAAGITRPSRANGPFVLRVASVGAIAALLAVEIPALHQWQTDQPVYSRTTASLLAAAQAPFGDYRPADTVLVQVVAGERQATNAQIATALRLTAADSAVDIHLSLLRDAAAARIGALSDPVAAARAELRHVDGSLDPYIPDLAQVMVDAGDPAQARSLLAENLQGQIHSGALNPAAVPELALWAQWLGRGGAYPCLVAGVGKVGGSDLVAGLPKPTSRCAQA